MDVNFSEMNYLPWLIPIGPLLAFILISILTNRSKLVPADDHHEYGGHHPDYDGMEVPVVTMRSRIVSVIVGLGSVLLAWVLSMIVFFNAIDAHHFGEEVFTSNLNWMESGLDALYMGVLVDPLTAVMLFFVPIAVVCIFIYSIGYMAHDPRQSRFFSLIALFAGAMLTLVVADNLLLLFIGWEIMGVCSYMLIGFWFEKETAYKAAIKAFTTTRVADVIMLLGIAYLFTMTGTLSFRDIMYNPAPEHIQQAYLEKHGEEVAHADEAEVTTEETDADHSEDVATEESHETEDSHAATDDGHGETADDHGGDHAEVVTWAKYLSTQPAIIFGSLSVSALIGIFLIIGTVGKSAQFPLHVWLPDAMEGPTPVSAMIHAAAMVSAGVYMIIRMYPLLEAGGDPHHGDLSEPLMLMAVVGAFTALFSATIAVAQNDVKRVLAYSTISQLGFMMAALGIGAYIAAAFHLMTHAFFKALLFMASGSVIHAMEHGEHHVHDHAHDGHHEDSDHDDKHEEHGHFDPQDMMNMGGLWKRIPITAYTFIIGGLSLSGFPLLTAGFWSKDEILADAWYVGTGETSVVHLFVFVMLALAAFLTAFYTTRQLYLTFGGDARTEEAEHAGLGGPTNIVSITMQLPLIILAFFAVTAGWIGVPSEFAIPPFAAIFSPEHNPFHHFVGGTLLHVADAPPFNWLPVLVSFAVALGGIYVGWLLYGRKPLKAGEQDPLIGIVGEPIHTILKNKYYIDEVYETVFVKPAQWFSQVAVSQFLDKGIIDGFLHLVARVATWIGDFAKVFNLWLIDGVGDGIPQGIERFGMWFRRVQTGRIQQYLLLVILAAMIIGLIFAMSTGLLQAAN